MSEEQAQVFIVLICALGGLAAGFTLLQYFRR